MREDHWYFQRYLWSENLKSTNCPDEKVIKTLIYGVKPSGNQAQRGLRMTAEILKDQYPVVNEIIRNDVYVDDCLSGDKSEEDAYVTADDIESVISRGGFSLKGVTFSNKDPPSHLSKDGKSISVAGMKWHPKDDEISLDVSELNFNPKIRAKKVKVK